MSFRKGKSKSTARDRDIGKPDTNFFSLNKTHILDLPAKLRGKVWRILGYSHTRTLRLVCTTFRNDIDKVVGISSAIDSTFEDFPFHSNVAIRKVSIHELIKPAYVEFLKYPLVLEELEVRGEITLKTFNYIIKTCPNIKILQIIFNKFVLEYNTKMFPLPEETRSFKPLSKLHSIKVIATTKKISEISYVHKNVMSLLNEPLLENNKIRSIHLLISHRTTSKLVKEMMASTLLFVHKHLSTLHYLNLNFRDKDPTASTAASGEATPSSSSTDLKQDEDGGKSDQEKAEKPATGARLNAKATNESKKSVDKAEIMSTSTQPVKVPRKPKPAPAPGSPPANEGGVTRRGKDVHEFDPGAVAAEAQEADDLPSNALPAESEGEANILPPSQIESSSSDEENDVVSLALKSLKNKNWPSTEKLEQLILSVPLRVLEGLTDMIHKDTELHTINLEGYGGNHQNWPVYAEFIKRSNPFYLEFVTFHHLNHITNKNGNPVPIDLRIFKDNRYLKKLTLLGDKKDDFSMLPRAAHLSALPTTLEEITIERLLLTQWQAFRLLYCFPDMHSVTLEYWSKNDRQFAMFMWLLKWVMKCDCTPVKKVNLVETKIRFNHERKAVRALQEALAVSTAYTDTVDTRLYINTKEEKNEKLIAPPLNPEENKSPPPLKPVRFTNKNK